MRAHSLKSSAGFTFIAAMIMVVIMGIMLGAVGQSWRMVIKRDKEAELLFRGGQILDAIDSWNRGPSSKPTSGRPPSSKPPATPIKDLKDLLEDPRSTQKVHHLRKVYLDPITNKDFDVIKVSPQGIIGVASSSKEKPLKVNFQNMSGVYKKFTDKKMYSEWQFVPSDLQKFIPGPTTVGLPPGSPPLPGGMP
jgi:type II secretory pathway pseudopilin PulG